MSETQLGREIRLDLGSGKTTRLFRNNVGVLKNERGEYIAFGLCPGSSDLIGIHRIKVTQDMVGSYVGLFVAIETKTKKGMAHKGVRKKMQGAFIQMVKDLGGLAGFATSIDHANQVLNLRTNTATLVP